MASPKDLYTNAFVDLIASALGCVIILMLVFSVKKPSAQIKTGKPRGFVYYNFEVSDPDAELELFFYKEGSNIRADFYIADTFSTSGPRAIKLGNHFDAVIWGPVKKDFNDNSPKRKYSLYVAMKEKGTWHFGLLYYNRTTLSPEMLMQPGNTAQLEIDKPIAIRQELITNEKADTSAYSSILLGDICKVSTTIK